MIIKEVVVSPEFRKDFDKLDTDLQNKVREILRSIEYGEKIEGVSHIPLRGDLTGFTSVNFNSNSYRLIYKPMKDKFKAFNFEKYLKSGLGRAFISRHFYD